jgi:hypothetical protein
MADTVRTLTVRNAVALNGWLVVNCTSESDGTGESAVAKIDISTFTCRNGSAATYSIVHRIEYNVTGMSVRLHWDHTTDDTIAELSGPASSTSPRTAGGWTRSRPAGRATSC